jgi:hypothetical protein
MGVLGLAVYVATVVVLLGLLVLGASRAVRLLRRVARRDIVLSETERFALVATVLVLALLIAGVVIGLLALAV